MIFLTTERLRVRHFAASDLIDFLAYQSLPQVRKHLPGSPMTEEQAEDYLSFQSSLAPDTRGKWHGFAVELTAETKVIGDIGFFYQSQKEEADIGFQFHPDYHDQGYAFEATAALVEFLFTNLPVQTVTSGCDKENRASYKLMEKLGLKQIVTTEISVSYAITREDWLTKLL